MGRFQARTLALRGSLDGSVTEHRAILAAIRLRDADKAAELTADSHPGPGAAAERNRLRGRPAALAGLTAGHVHGYGVTAYSSPSSRYIP